MSEITGAREIGYQEALTGGCHGLEKGTMAPFVRKGAAIPPNILGCNDNIGSVELLGKIEIGYLMRPNMYDRAGLELVYESKLHMPLVGLEDEKNQLDALIWNYRPVLATPNNRTLIPAKTEKFVGSLLRDLKALQLRDIGRFFGANNPWISHPPDSHACMPGIPDDEAFIVLFLLLTGYKLA